MTRLMDAFSKKWLNHNAALAVYLTYYNFCRVHQTLRVTPAMEAGVTDHIWTIKEQTELIDQKALLTPMLYSPSKSNQHGLLNFK